jgi:hypothetical protein
MSAISMSPAFIFCTSSPSPGTNSTKVQSARRTISTSSWPTPTVSTSTNCLPAASRINATSPVVRASPPSDPRVAMDRMKMPASLACPCIRMRSPNIAPPVYGLVGSTAIIPTASPPRRYSAARRSTSVLLPVPGAPVTPSTKARPVRGKISFRRFSDCGPWSSIAVMAREIDRTSPAQI